MAKTWTRTTDFTSTPATVPYTAGSAANWTVHTCSGWVPAHIHVTNRGGVAAYIVQGVTVTDGVARSGEGHKLDPGETRRLDFVDKQGGSIGASLATWGTVGVSLEFYFTLCD